MNEEYMMRFKHRFDGHYEIFIFSDKNALKSFLFKNMITKQYIEREQLN